MPEHLLDGRAIACPLGRTAHCGAAVFCTVENRVLAQDGPEADPASLDKFCTAKYIQCPTFQLFAELNANQHQSHVKAQRALDGEIDIDNEILEPYGISAEGN